MKSVCVYCGASPGNGNRYLEVARSVGASIASRGLELVYGGSHVGTMGALADGALAAGGRVYGVLPKGLMQMEIAHTGLTEFRVAESLHERKALMSARADAFVALPGGYGTLDELFEALTWTQVSVHDKPCGLLNVDGFYDHLIAFLDHATGQGLIRPALRTILLAETDIDRLLDGLASFRVPDEVKAITRPPVKP